MQTNHLILALAGLCGVCLFADDAAPLPEHAIVLSAADTILTFGRTTQLTVSYQNRAPAPWMVKNPAVSTATWVMFGRVGATERPHGYTLPPPRPAPPPRPDGLLRPSTVPFAEPVPIRLGEPRVVEVPFRRGWTGKLVPGVWDVWIYDSWQEMESNRVRIAVRFTRDSITACLAQATTRGVRGAEQKWHADWLKKIMPGLDVRWGKVGFPPEELARMRAQRAKGFEKFRAFLKDPRNAEAIQAAIDQINREAGLPVEEGKPVAGGQ